jgi:hypothetical protein
VDNVFSFSVAGVVNVKFTDFPEGSNVLAFLKKMYLNFSEPVIDPIYRIDVCIQDVANLDVSQGYSLGKDAIINNRIVKLSSGHTYSRSGNCISVFVPSKVKRGRIPFERETPGRHITDEIVEPLLKNILPACGKTFLHASSYVEANKANIVMAWRNTGKTDAILKHFGHKHIFSDDLAILSDDGFVFPYPRPMRVYSYNLGKMPISKLDLFRLRLKSLITPPWQPVEYVSLDTGGFESLPVGDVVYLNDSNCSSLPFIAKQILDFEYSYFDQTANILRMAGVLGEEVGADMVLDGVI